MLFYAVAFYAYAIYILALVFSFSSLVMVALLWRYYRKHIRSVLLIALATLFMAPEIEFSVVAIRDKIQLVTATKVENYKENLVYLNGIKEPMGLHISFDITPARRVTAYDIMTPQIRMGKYVENMPDNAFFSIHFHGTYGSYNNVGMPEIKDLALLKETTTGKYTYGTVGGSKRKKWWPAQFSAADNAVHLDFYLYPGILTELHSSGKLCLATMPQKTRLVYHSGTDISVLWPLTTGVSDSVSRQLTDLMRENSLLQHNPELWDKFQRNYSGDFFRHYGYKNCPGSKRETCYCPSAS